MTVPQALAAIAIGTLCGWLLLAAGVLVLAVVRCAGRANEMQMQPEMHEYDSYYDPLMGGDVYICPVCGRMVFHRGIVQTVMCPGDPSAIHRGTALPADPPEFTAWADQHAAELETL